MIRAESGGQGGSVISHLDVQGFCAIDGQTRGQRVTTTVCNTTVTDVGCNRVSSTGVGVVDDHVVELLAACCIGSQGVANEVDGGHGVAGLVKVLMPASAASPSTRSVVRGRCRRECQGTGVATAGHTQGLAFNGQIGSRRCLSNTQRVSTRTALDRGARCQSANHVQRVGAGRVDMSNKVA